MEDADTARFVQLGMSITGESEIEFIGRSVRSRIDALTASQPSPRVITPAPDPARQDPDIGLIGDWETTDADTAKRQPTKAQLDALAKARAAKKTPKPRKGAEPDGMLDRDTTAQDLAAAILRFIGKEQQGRVFTLSDLAKGVGYCGESRAPGRGGAALRHRLEAFDAPFEKNEDGKRVYPDWVLWECLAATAGESTN